jgi:hypothetical protein
MGLLADNFVLTHISLKCLFTKKWRERERERKTRRYREMKRSGQR